MPSPATAKVAGQIKTIAASMIQRRIQDPSLELLTITDVRLSKDWHKCELFYTVLGDAVQWQQAAQGLEQAKGQIRTQVARQLKMRFAPELSFLPDAMPEQSAQFEALLAATRQADARVADLAEGADYAGDPDPYKKPDTEADEDWPDEADEAAL